MQLDYDSGTNTLRLTPDSAADGSAARRIVLAGFVDVAEGGRLSGVEVAGLSEAWLHAWQVDADPDNAVAVAGDTAYFQLSSGDDRNVRSMPVSVEAEFGTNGELLALAIPRRGAGYEISYPSGNQ